MIAWLRGRCQSVAVDHVVLDVAGVGYLVQASARDSATWAVGDEIEVLVHTVVREDAILLYGFGNVAARDLFTALVSVSGVGPKGALALLSELTPREIAMAIHNEQMSELVRAKGIGKRTAELIVVRLRERLPVDLLSGGAGGGATSPPSAETATPPALRSWTCRCQPGP